MSFANQPIALRGSHDNMEHLSQCNQCKHLKSARSGVELRKGHWICSGCWNSKMNPGSSKTSSRLITNENTAMKTMITDKAFNLRNIRTNLLKITQEDLADKLGISLRTYIRYESSDRLPPMARRDINALLVERGITPIQHATAPARKL